MNGVGGVGAGMGLGLGPGAWKTEMGRDIRDMRDMRMKGVGALIQ